MGDGGRWAMSGRRKVRCGGISRQRGAARSHGKGGRLFYEVPWLRELPGVEPTQEPRRPASDGGGGGVRAGRASSSERRMRRREEEEVEEVELYTHGNDWREVFHQ